MKMSENKVLLQEEEFSDEDWVDKVYLGLVIIQCFMLLAALTAGPTGVQQWRKPLQHQQNVLVRLTRNFYNFFFELFYSLHLFFGLFVTEFPPFVYQMPRHVFCGICIYHYMSKANPMEKSSLLILFEIDFFVTLGTWIIYINNWRLGRNAYFDEARIQFPGEAAAGKGNNELLVPPSTSEELERQLLQQVGGGGGSSSSSSSSSNHVVLKSPEAVHPLDSFWAIIGQRCSPLVRGWKNGRWTYPDAELIEKDVMYASEQEIESIGIDLCKRFLRLDVFRMKGAGSSNKLMPVIVFIHGGGFATNLNSKDDINPVPLFFTELGWIGVSVEYRTYPQGIWPDLLVDIKRSLRWVQQNIRRYGGDPNFVCIAGASAGGFLALSAALTCNDPKFQPGFEAVSTSIRACFAIYPVCDVSSDSMRWLPWSSPGFRFLAGGFQTTVQEASYSEMDSYSPVNLIKRVDVRNVPPIFIEHGQLDSAVPIHTHSEAFMKLLLGRLPEEDRGSEETAKRFKLMSLLFTHHAFDMATGPAHFYWLAYASLFLGEVYDKYRHSSISNSQ